MRTWNQIQRPELIESIRRFMGSRQAHVTPTFSPEIQLVVVAGDVRDAANLARSTAAATALRRPAGWFATRAASIGNFSKIRLRNPPNSGYSIMLERGHVNSATGTSYEFSTFPTLTDLTPSSLHCFLDSVTDNPLLTAPSIDPMIISAGVEPALDAPSVTIASGAGEIAWGQILIGFGSPWIVAPGWCFEIQTTANNTQVNATITGYLTPATTI